MDQQNVEALPQRPGFQKRLTLLALLSAIGGALFVPFATESQATAETWALFTVGATIAGALCSWGGLIAADRARLPMPVLRSWETGQPIAISVILRIMMFAAPVGLAAGFFAVGATFYLDVPQNHGTLLVRLLTIPFASIVTEIVAHLLILSVLFLWLKKKWIALLVSSLIFVLVFHGQIFDSPEITALVIATNFVFFTLTGWGYIRYGFVCAVLTHAIAHGIMLGIN